MPDSSHIKKKSICVGVYVPGVSVGMRPAIHRLPRWWSHLERGKSPQDFLEFPKQLIDALQEFPGRRSKACDVCPLLAGLYRRRKVPDERTFRKRQSRL